MAEEKNIEEMPETEVSDKLQEEPSEEVKKDSLEETPEEQEENDEITPQEEAFEKGYEESSKPTEEEKAVGEEISEEEAPVNTEEKPKEIVKEKQTAPVINDKPKVNAHLIGGSSLSTAAALPEMKGSREIEEEVEEEPEEKEEQKEKETSDVEPTKIFALRTTANREDQVMDFVGSNAARKKLAVYSVISPHGMRGYIFLEALNKQEAEQAAYGVPYAKGILPSEVQYSEIEHMLEQVKKEINIQKNDIAEILTGPFKREKCKITRIDKTKDEVVVELLEAAVPIPITLKIDAVKVIRREKNE